MKITGIIRVTKYAPDGAWINIETPAITGNLKAFVPGIAPGQFSGAEHPFELEISENETPKPAEEKPEIGKRKGKKKEEA